MDYTYKIEGAFSGDAAIIAKFQAMTAAANVFNAALKQQGTTARTAGAAQTNQTKQQTQQIVQQQTALNKLATGYHHFYSGMRESGAIVREQIGALSEYVDAAKDLQRAEMRFKALNLSQADTAKGFSEIRRVAKEVGGVRLDALTDQLTDLHAVFGDLKEAIHFLPSAAKTQYVFGALFGESPKEAERDIRDMMKALEQQGALRATGAKDAHGIAQYTDKDLARFHEYYDVMVKAKALTGGRVGGREWLQYMATGGVAAKQLSPEGMLKQLFAVQEFGGGRAGTNLSAIFSGFAALRQGAGSQRAVMAMIKLGLVDMEEFKKQGLKFSKEGRVLGVPRPGLVPIASQIGANPLEFGKSLYEGIAKNGKQLFPRGIGGKEFDATDPQHLALALSQITGRQTAMSGLASMMIQLRQYEKEAQLAAGAKGLDELKTMVDESDVGKMLKFEAAYKNFQMTAGAPMLQLLAGIAGVAGPAFQWLALHPTVVKFAGGLILLARSAHMTLGVLGAMRGLMASEAIINNLGTSAVGSAGKVGFLGGALKALPSLIAVTVVVAGIAEILDQIDKVKQAQKEADDSAEGLAKATANLQSAKGFDPNKLREMYRKRAITDFAGLWSNVENSSMFLNLFGLQASPRSMTKGSLAGTMQRSMPGLEKPNAGAQYGMFMRELDRRKSYGGLETKDWGAFVEAAKTAFPKAAKEWEEALRRNAGSETKAVDELVRKEQEAAQMLKEATDKMAGSLTEVSGGLDTLAEKLKNFQPGGAPPPTPEPEASHAAGGLTRRTHIARVHGNEFIVPLEKAQSFFKGAMGPAGPISLSFSSPIQVVGGEPAQIKAAVFEGIMAGKHELERALNIMWKDRRQGA